MYRPFKNKILSQTATILLLTFSLNLLLQIPANARRVHTLSVLDQYRGIVSEESIAIIKGLAKDLESRKELEVNTTLQGGGVAEILQTMVPIFKELGIDAERLIFNVGDHDDIAMVIKKIFNAFQGKEDIEITNQEMKALEDFAIEFTDANIETLRDVELMVLHDGAIVLASIIKARLGEDSPKFIWRLHYDSSKPTTAVDDFVKRYSDAADYIVYSMPDYVIKGVDKPYDLIPPAIDPISDKNRELTKDRREKIIREYGVDPERPMLVQVSRFDYFKDPLGVIEVYKKAKQSIPDLQLVLFGGTASDDPEGQLILKSVREKSGEDPDIHIITENNDIAVNAFQAGIGNTVVIQKSLRESFGLVVAEAMWKNTPVVASNVGGISYQIADNTTGFLYQPTDISGFAERVVSLFRNPTIREAIGESAHDFVANNFLTPSIIENRLRLFRVVLGIDSP